MEYIDGEGMARAEVDEGYAYMRETNAYSKKSVLILRLEQVCIRASGNVSFTSSETIDRRAMLHETPKDGTGLRSHSISIRQDVKVSELA